jgi:hypothetical protein
MQVCCRQVIRSSPSRTRLARPVPPHRSGASPGPDCLGPPPVRRVLAQRAATARFAAELERCWNLTPSLFRQRLLAASWQSAFCTCRLQAEACLPSLRHEPGRACPGTRATASSAPRLLKIDRFLDSYVM